MDPDKTVQYNLPHLDLHCLQARHSTFWHIGPGGTVSGASRGSSPRFDIWSVHILLFLLPLIQEGQLSATGQSMCTKYWLTA